MDMIDRIKRRLHINRAVRELSSLPDNMLADIGMERRNIAELVEKMIDANAAFEHSVVRRAQVLQPAGYQVSNRAIV